MKLKIKQLDKRASIPEYATDGSGCFDLQAVMSERHFVCLSEMSGTHIFGTGLSFEIPKGYCMLIFSRSGQGFNKDVRLSNCVGVIDSDYRGEVKVKLIQDVIGANDYIVGHGDRIAQGMIIPVPKVEFELVEELSDTVRGTGGLGSTGQ